MVEAIRPAEVVLFAVPGLAMDETISSNANILAGKLAIDTANKIGAAVFCLHPHHLRY